ncbi:MAG TPA: CHAT domain-containing tetratricopeptide repeat protein [Verrucomicrobiae bacterium]|nr:CHAT domain-containing tetratricopeptide repeat protein [Verrucomicrobiae bacterium]
MADKGLHGSENQDATWNWKFRILKAEALLRAGRYGETVSLLDPEPPDTVFAEIRVRKRTVQAQALCRVGKGERAQNILAEAEKLSQLAGRDLAAGVAFSRAACALSTDLKVALRYYQQAAELAQGGDPFIRANALLGVGYVLLRSDLYDESIAPLAHALSLTEYPLIRETAQGNLGFSYAQLGDFKRAIDYSKQAAEIAEELTRLDARERWLLDLGRAYAALPGDYPGEAEVQYHEALLLATRLKDEDTARKCLHNLAQLAIKEHEPDKAERYWKEEKTHIPDNDDDPDSSLDEAEIAYARNEFAKAEQLFEVIAANPKTNAVRRSMAQERLGSVYWSEKKVVQADQMFREGIDTAEKALTKIRPEYRTSFLDEHPFFDAYIRFMVAQNKPAQALHLVEHVRSLTQVADAADTAKARFDIATIRSRLKKTQEIVLDYQVTDHESFLWVITPSEFEVFHLPKHFDLYSQIAAYSGEIRDHRNTEGSLAGEKLYATLVQPAARLIPKGSRVTIVPSKILSLINFETLVVPGLPGAKPHYWIEDVAVQETSSLAGLQTLKPSRKATGSTKDMLLIGAPVEVDKDFDGLRHAAEEMDRVSKRFPGSSTAVRSGKEATPKTYLSGAPGDYRFIHFVAHGTASEKIPMESAIVLSLDDTNAYKLYARDIVKTPLHADLVTISACYGVGTRWYQSEGIVGLAWAFQHAGARQVVAGLWDVDDAATPELMDHFYAAIQNGKSAADALRSAKLTMLHSNTVYRHPFYWASLQLYTGR